MPGRMVVVPCCTLSWSKRKSNLSVSLAFCFLLYLFRSSAEWIQVSNNVKPGGNFVVLDLDPAVWYHLRVTAHNNAGFNVAEYEFATLTVTGGRFARMGRRCTCASTT